ncbi:hypothetical protein FNV43_RR09847 [Rhamnella rubrinervis]|uniref:Uncharacterized protein n=1 Tax=Rhamnella rubrinervis TaxID=2594499 RepID=A0A8K0MKC2_9ROSA|nr:hypothetical protein FNV43_RR09847 [Rhamnella rubrinervis]
MIITIAYLITPSSQMVIQDWIHIAHSPPSLTSLTFIFVEPATSLEVLEEGLWLSFGTKPSEPISSNFEQHLGIRNDKTFLPWSLSSNDGRMSQRSSWKHSGHIGARLKSPQQIHELNNLWQDRRVSPIHRVHNRGTRCKSLINRQLLDTFNAAYKHP